MLIPDNLFDYGGELIDESQLNAEMLGLLQACQANPSCDIIELRQDSVSGVQSLMVDLGDGTFDISNSIGIGRNERIALSYCENGKYPWEVRPLRKDFPITSYSNYSAPNEPRSLCLYDATWEAVERSWTPEMFLERIFWWLRATAEGEIRNPDQRIEQLFFGSSHSVVLPRDYLNNADPENLKSLVFREVRNELTDSHLLIGDYKNNIPNTESFCFSLPILLPAVEYGPIEEPAQTLGQLNSLLKQRECDLIGPLCSAIQLQVDDDGVEASKNAMTLLILGMPRTYKGEDCGVELQGFIIRMDYCQLGQKLDVLQKMPGSAKYFKYVSFDKLNDGYEAIVEESSENWETIPIFPVNITNYPDEKTVRRYSGLSPDEKGPMGIIAGVGALGGLLAKIWSAECWGHWHYVDADIVQAHNLVRHIANHHCIGFPKAKIVSEIVQNIHPPSENPMTRAVVANIEDDNEVIQKLIDSSDLIVDVTTTLHVPRIIGRNEAYPRTVSVFLTPSGLSSVMLLEDSSRNIRCNNIEAQYFRAILELDWGEKHLGGHSGGLKASGGCRETTLELSSEVLHLHAGNLARQLRKHIESDDAKICIWEYQEENGSTVIHEVEVYQSTSITVGDWEVIFDDSIVRSAKKQRVGALPAETGGILLGIVDQKDQTITLVKSCEPPSNSEGSQMEFRRAAYETEEFMQNCLDRTADVITYVGEWHSHPEGVSPLPSVSDINQHAFVHDSLIKEGRPALMMIVSENQLGLYIGETGSVITISKNEVPLLAKAG